VEKFLDLDSCVIEGSFTFQLLWYFSWHAKVKSAGLSIYLFEIDDPLSFDCARSRSNAELFPTANTNSACAAVRRAGPSRLEWKHTAMMLHFFIVCAETDECCMRAAHDACIQISTRLEEIPRLGVLLLLLVPGRVQTKSMHNENVKNRTARIFYIMLLYLRALTRLCVASTSHLICFSKSE
jgi:hypothetical protein